MFVKINKRKKNGKTYKYVSIVQGYRDKDGKVKHKELLYLGRLTEKEIDSLIHWEALPLKLPRIKFRN